MNTTQITRGETFAGSFEYLGKNYQYFIKNIWPDADFESGEDIFLLSFPFANYSQEFEAKDLDEAIKSLTDFVDFFASSNPQTSDVLENLKRKYSEPHFVRTSMNFYPEDIAKAKEAAASLGVSYQVFIRDFLHESLRSL